MNAHDRASHEARIRALDASWLAAAANRNLDGMLAIYAPDAQELLPSLLPIVGREAIRTFYAGIQVEYPRHAYQFEQTEIWIAESGDLAVARGTYRFTPDTEHPDSAQTGKFVGVWRRADGDWRLALNISNEDPPAAG
jgi:uncharacterized protein (TIGR02246 family)